MRAAVDLLAGESVQGGRHGGDRALPMRHWAARVANSDF
jgi:hypothetical protein